MKLWTLCLTTLVVFSTTFLLCQAQQQEEQEAEWVLPEGVEGVPEGVWSLVHFPEPEINAATGLPFPHCATDYLWEAYAKFYHQVGIRLNNGCEAETSCDEPQVRDQYTPRPGEVMVVDTVVNVICSAPDVCPSGVNAQVVREQMETLNEDFKLANVYFKLEEENIRFHVDASLSTIAAYSILPTWYNQIRTVKSLYAKQPAHYLNIFITGQKNGLMGTLLGIGTFPWDPEALTEYGGLWLNAQFTGRGERTLSHEAGHNVGLWHSFHGVEEVKCGSDCYENPHPLNDSTADFVGDFCADTPSQPRNYECALPAGAACDGQEYTAYGDEGLLFNLMSYHMDDCLHSFTLQQASRSNCYLCNSVPSLLANPEACTSE